LRRETHSFVAVGLAGVVLLCAASGGAYLSAIHWVDHTLEVRQAVHEWSVDLLDLVIGARDYVVSRRPERLDAYEHALAQEQAQAALVRGLVGDNADEVTHVQVADAAARALKQRLHDVVSLTQAGYGEAAADVLARGAGIKELDAFRRDVSRVLEQEARLLQERRHRAATRGWWTSAGALLLVVISWCLLVYAVRRQRSAKAVRGGLPA
jgi:CHASE3 domain sensor protein